MCNFNKNNKGRRIDFCLKPLLKWLTSNDYTVVASCCGHEKYPMTIVVKYMYNGIPKYFELLSNIELLRTKKFYKRDWEGVYYIPEII